MAQTVCLMLGLCCLGAAVSCAPQGETGNGGSAAPATAPADLSAEQTPAPAATASANETAQQPAVKRETQALPFLARAAQPVVVLGRFAPGRLDMRGGCLTVTLAESGRTATAVFPPDARLVQRDGRPSAVAYGARSIPIGVDTRIPGGGSVTAQRLAAPLPTGCPRELFPIGG